MGLPYSENFKNPNLNRFRMIHPCDRQTYRRTDRRTDGR